MKKSEFFEKWLTVFASDVSNAQIERYVKSTGNFLWHIFSWDLLGKSKYLCGEEAKKAYDKVNKDGALYIDWFEDDFVKPLSLELRNVNSLDGFVEVYVADKDFKWTYIKTHEIDCGPYFMEVQ